ncbi:AIR synthase family protein [Thermococcus thioreducens]|uniref:Hydrogenase n=1 Tax=Thermococcus thioreducens TaxID=277988 RepID=A0A0Q2M333_9EURY|nr:AIR synthase family protein [Thermococcus thioreducens]ASJ12542.1 hydrogenase [Thermococcus thioreducens]KQH82457.1 hydrogenase [Thermococcus thioreducens]SEV89067.1 thiamine-phosphate kinase/hydrogenase expression/formation protein HypE,TIGR02124 [Thermococcus thioreducens]
MLPPGKIPPEKLRELVFNHLGARGERVIIGADLGIDAAAIDFGSSILVASTDPITGAEKGIGFYAVHINANDVATFGARPKWFLVSILLPENADESLLAGIMEELHKSASKLGVAIVGGHTEVTPGLERPIVVGTMLGEVDQEKLVTSNGAKPGDAVIVTKWAGLEGTSIIASERSGELERAFGREFVEKARSFIEMISVVEDALTANEVGVHAMHDPTEGGIANGLHEMADAAGVGFRVYRERIPIREETLKICGFYNLDPLALISSGTLMVAAPKEQAKAVVEALRGKGINAAVIGEFVEDPGVKVIVENGKERPLERPESDELWKVV